MTEKALGSRALVCTNMPFSVTPSLDFRENEGDWQGASRAVNPAKAIWGLSLADLAHHTPKELRARSTYRF